MTDPQPPTIGESMTLATLTPEALATALRAAADSLAATMPAAGGPLDTPTPSDGPKRFSVPMVVAVLGAAFESGLFASVANREQVFGNLLDAVGATQTPPAGPHDLKALFVVALTAYGQPGVADGLNYPAAWASLSASFATMPPWAF